jgi:Kelch motif
MGCSCSKSKDLIVTFKGVKKEKPGGFNDFFQVLQWVYKEFPELRCQGLDIRSNSKLIKSPSDYTSMYNSSKVLEISIEKSQSCISTSIGIFKIRLELDDLLCTGFLVSSDYALVPENFINLKNYSRISLLFEDNTEIKLKPNTGLISIGYNFALAELESEITHFEPVPIDTKQQFSYGLSKICYYSKLFPILQEQTINFEPYFSEDQPLGIELQDGAIGSPVISSENTLLGIVNSKTSMLKSQYINQKVHEHIKIEAEKTRNSIIEFRRFDLTTCFLDCRKQKLVYYSPEDALNKVLSSPEMLQGSVAISTKFGIFATGLNPLQQPISWIFDGKSIKTLPPTQKRHLHHASIAIDNLVYVISGSTLAVEIYDFDSNTWTLSTPLKKRRIMATPVHIKSKIYLIGGRRENKILKSIIRLKDSNWEKLDLILPKNIAAVGCLCIENQLILFGGETKEGPNDASYKIDIKNKLITNEKHSIVNNFGKFSVLYLPDEILFYSNQGILFKYDPVSPEIFKVSLDQEQFF